MIIASIRFDYRRLFRLYVLLAEGVAFLGRRGQHFAQEAERVPEQRVGCGNELIVNDVQAELNDLMIAPLVQVESEARAVKIVEPFAERYVSG